MPRNPSTGVYTLPEEPVNGGELISSDWANATLADIADALTQSVSSTGSTPIEAPLRLVNGSGALPAITFREKSTVGFYLDPTYNDPAIMGADRGALNASWDASVKMRVTNKGMIVPTVIGTTDFIQGASVPSIGTEAASSLGSLAVNYESLLVILQNEAQGLKFKGYFDASSGVLPTPDLGDTEKGELYFISVGGTLSLSINGATAPENLEVKEGDRIIYSPEQDFWVRAKNVISASDVIFNATGTDFPVAGDNKVDTVQKALSYLPNLYPLLSNNNSFSGTQSFYEIKSQIQRFSRFDVLNEYTIRTELTNTVGSYLVSWGNKDGGSGSTEAIFSDGERLFQSPINTFENGLRMPREQKVRFSGSTNPLNGGGFTAAGAWEMDSNSGGNFVLRSYNPDAQAFAARLVGNVNTFEVRNKDSEIVALFEDIGTSSSDAKTVMTREKGDARYISTGAGSAGTVGQDLNFIDQKGLGFNSGSLPSDGKSKYRILNTDDAASGGLVFQTKVGTSYTTFMRADSTYPVFDNGFITKSFNLDNNQGMVFNATGRSGFGGNKGELTGDFLAYMDNNNTFRITRKATSSSRPSVFAANATTTNLYQPDGNPCVLASQAQLAFRHNNVEILKIDGSGDRKATFTVKNGTGTKTRTLGGTGSDELASAGDVAQQTSIKAEIKVGNTEAAAKTGSEVLGEENNLWVWFED